MSAIQILQVGPLAPQTNSTLQERFSAAALWQQADPLSWAREHGGEVRVVVTSARHGCTAALIGALPKLEAIVSFGVGYDSIALDAVRARGIQVSNTPDVLNDCVADLAFGLLIDAARGIAHGDRFVRAQHWPQGGFPLTTRVSGKKLGILGLGRIGEIVARRASGFDMEIAYHNRRPRDGAPWRFEGDLKALAAWADFLVVAVVGGPETAGLVSREIIDALGPKGILVNVSRGSVIDEAAMVEALVEGRLGGAGLDVFRDEPNVPPALLALDNVVLAPHMASGTHETRTAMTALTLQNLEAFLATGKVLTPVL
ncbi:2-hydroxyacid dehydrogenase [Cupriavidus pinatubonensis]|uniref:2-ketogluconate reductase n=1 Tax=Cupriavidus pinatubonensis TaxID=248026 RepID=A0ABN7ZEV2_9BURK|nr:2-hydroxyacid dehydrogenase [Cupriavidus pinatubonensis]CAG9184494.1 2-ketogluconate reductase [Cupriavidus pinatubonensis]